MYFFLGIGEVWDWKDFQNGEFYVFPNFLAFIISGTSILSIKIVYYTLYIILQ